MDQFHTPADKDRLHSRMRKYVNRHFHIIFKRMLYVLLFVSIQIAVIVFFFVYLTKLTPYFLLFCMLITASASIHIINKNNNPAYKIAWLIPLAVFPIFGGLLYLMFGSRRVNRHQREITAVMREHYQSTAAQIPPADIDADLPRDVFLMANYITNASGCLPYANTQTEYFPSGEAFFPALCDALRHAKRYIFLEFFIIAEGVFWDTVLSILEERASQGVEVRVLYDDFGSMLTLPLNYDKLLRQKGIRAHVFNPFNTVLHPRPNNRDHRKIAVIDGTCAFVGGINIGDEYINTKKRLGYWKDTAIKLCGDAAWGVALQFLSVWDSDTKEKADLGAYLPAEDPHMPYVENGIIQPFTDIPMDNEQVGESVYFQMITRAQKYIYITTPYLIIDHELLVALQTAAKSGVDVRIITPHIPDKKSIFFLTHSYYTPLLEAGVRISEFTPGFVHAKMMISDDRFAVVGSINLDYRSLYLHLENAVWMYNTDTVLPIRDDFLATWEQSETVTPKSISKLTPLKRLWLSILRTLAPLM